MITVADFAAWALALPGWPRKDSKPLPIYGPDQLDIAGLDDWCVFVTATPGPGFLLEQAFDVAGAQLRFRGDQGDYNDTENTAKTVDKLLVTAWPTTIGGSYVGFISRVGSAPTYLFRDTARRSHFTGNYLFTAAY